MEVAPCTASRCEPCDRQELPSSITNQPFWIHRSSAASLQSQGKIAEALVEYEKALEEWHTAVKSGFSSECIGLFEPFVLNELGVLRARSGDVAGAVRNFDSAVQIIHQQIVTNQAKSMCTITPQCLLMETKKHLAMALKSGGAYGQASTLFEELIHAYRPNGPYPNKILLADCCFHLACLLNSQSLFTRAEPYIRECVQVRREIFGAREAESKEACGNDGQCRTRFCSSLASEIAVALCLLATTIASPAIAKFDEAESSLQEAIAVTQDCPSDVCTKQDLERMTALLGSIRATRDLAEAQKNVQPPQESPVNQTE